MEMGERGEVGQRQRASQHNMQGSLSEPARRELSGSFSFAPQNQGGREMGWCGIQVEGNSGTDN